MDAAVPLLPGFIVAGVPKAATSSLWNYLAEHPGVAASAVKETKYWSPLRYPDRQVAPIEHYYAQWAGSDPVLLRMEATPGYFYGGRAVAEAIKASCPDVRVLIVLREPASRMLSGLRYMQGRQTVPVEMTFREYVDKCRAELAQGSREARSNFGIRAGLYNVDLASWIEVYGERLRVAFFDDVVREPRAVLAELCTWLGIDPDPVADLSLEEQNRTYAYRNEGLQRVALRVRKAGAGSLLRNPVVKKLSVGLYRKMNAKPSARGVDPEEKAVLAEMATWYAEQNAGLREMLAGVQVVGRIPDWVT